MKNFRQKSARTTDRMKNLPLFLSLFVVMAMMALHAAPKTSDQQSNGAVLQAGGQPPSVCQPTATPPIDNPPHG